jgi:hypothetical protein
MRDADTGWFIVWGIESDVDLVIPVTDESIYFRSTTTADTQLARTLQLLRIRKPGVASRQRFTQAFFDLSVVVG